MLKTALLERPRFAEHNSPSVASTPRKSFLRASSITPSSGGTPSFDDGADIKRSLDQIFLACQRELSILARYLDADFQLRLTRQLRVLLDLDEWEVGHALPKPASFCTLVRAMVLLEPRMRPMLGLSDSGYIIGMWGTNTSRFVIDFYPDDSIRWYSRQIANGEEETASGRTSVGNLAKIVGAVDARATIDGTR